MKRFLKGCIAFAFAIAIMVPQLPASQAVELIRSPVIVALAYGSSAMDGANILNSIGSGYEYGYLDEDRNFIPVGYTSQTGISAVKTQNVYYTMLDSGFNGYTDSATTSIGVGCYHIEMPYTFETFEEAQSYASGLSGGFVAWINGVYSVRVGSYFDGNSASVAMENLGLADGTVVGTSSYGISVVKTGDSEIIFQFDPQGEVGLVCMPLATEEEKAETWFSGYRYYGGFQFQRVDGGDLVVCSVVEEEDYISCVLSQEMSDAWPLEALKAQAVAVRTYCATNYGRHTDIYADICNTTHCQAYIGCAKAGDNTFQAAQETAGIYAWYEGELVETYYYSCNGGMTESVQNVWNETIPYLVGKVDPYEPLVASETGKYNWSVTYTADELTSLLNASGYVNAGIVDVYVSSRTEIGNVYSITFVDSAEKNWTFYKEAARTILGLNSTNYSVIGGSGESGSYFTAEGGTIASITSSYVIGGDGTTVQMTGTPYVITSAGTEVLTAPEVESETVVGDTFTIVGSGWGHSVGMSQWGAYSMAQLGYNYEEILTFYYTGIEVY